MHIAILSITLCYSGNDKGLIFETPHLYHSLIHNGGLPRSTSSTVHIGARESLVDFYAPEQRQISALN